MSPLSGGGHFLIHVSVPNRIHTIKWRLWFASRFSVLASCNRPRSILSLFLWLEDLSQTGQFHVTCRISFACRNPHILAQMWKVFRYFGCLFLLSYLTTLSACNNTIVLLIFECRHSEVMNARCRELLFPVPDNLPYSERQGGSDPILNFNKARVWIKVGVSVWVTKKGNRVLYPRVKPLGGHLTRETLKHWHGAKLIRFSPTRSSAVGAMLHTPTRCQALLHGCQAIPWMSSPLEVWQYTRINIKPCLSCLAVSLGAPLQWAHDAAELTTLDGDLLRGCLGPVRLLIIVFFWGGGGVIFCWHQAFQLKPFSFFFWLLSHWAASCEQ